MDRSRFRPKRNFKVTLRGSSVTSLGFEYIIKIKELGYNNRGAGLFNVQTDSSYMKSERNLKIHKKDSQTVSKSNPTSCPWHEWGGAGHHSDEGAEACCGWRWRVEARGRWGLNLLYLFSRWHREEVRNSPSCPWPQNVLNFTGELCLRLWFSPWDSPQHALTFGCFILTLSSCLRLPVFFPSHDLYVYFTLEAIVICFIKLSYTYHVFMDEDKRWNIGRWWRLTASFIFLHFFHYTRCPLYSSLICVLSGFSWRWRRRWWPRRRQRRRRSR